MTKKEVVQAKKRKTGSIKRKPTSARKTKKKVAAKSTSKKTVAKSIVHESGSLVLISTVKKPVTPKDVATRAKGVLYRDPTPDPKAAAKGTKPVLDTVPTAPPPTTATNGARKGKRKHQAVPFKEPIITGPLVVIGAGGLRTPVATRPTVVKEISTLEPTGRIQYEDAELEEFKELIDKKLTEARKEYASLAGSLNRSNNNGTDDTSPGFKLVEEGSDNLSREETAQLAARLERFIVHLEDALVRIRNKTYGFCPVMKRLISKERLRLVPHATMSIEGKRKLEERKLAHAS